MNALCENSVSIFQSFICASFCLAKFFYQFLELLRNLLFEVGFFNWQYINYFFFDCFIANVLHELLFLRENFDYLLISYSVLSFYFFYTFELVPLVLPEKSTFRAQPFTIYHTNYFDRTLMQQAKLSFLPLLASLYLVGIASKRQLRSLCFNFR